ncbi:MAG: IPTL-CTERM sorting domain-containing protein, partial [Methanosarcinaceae archaeon]|nr:IPTL-CTERM sorting domain-containing protein [Methanosarcinaceae archaeon]
ATITGGTLTITGISSAPEDGLSGIQLQTSSASTSIPTMTQWGMIVFVVLAGLGAVYYMRRQKRANS